MAESVAPLGRSRSKRWWCCTECALRLGASYDLQYNPRVASSLGSLPATWLFAASGRAREAVSRPLVAGRIRNAPREAVVRTGRACDRGGRPEMMFMNRRRCATSLELPERIPPNAVHGRTNTRSCAALPPVPAESGTRLRLDNGSRGVERGVGRDADAAGRLRFAAHELDG